MNTLVEPCRLENQVNGIIVTKIPQPNSDGTYWFQVLERYPEHDVRYFIHVAASSVSFIVCERGYIVQVLPGVFNPIYEKAERLGFEAFIYPKFNY